jgi:hypothetical protein
VWNGMGSEKKKKKTPVNYRCKRNNRRSLVL